MSYDGSDSSQYIDFDYAEVFQAGQLTSEDSIPSVASTSVSQSAVGDFVLTYCPALHHPTKHSRQSKNFPSEPTSPLLIAAADDSSIKQQQTLLAGSHCWNQYVKPPKLCSSLTSGAAFGALFGLCILLAILILLRKCRNRTHSGFEYPFKGISGFTDRFKKASMVERGESQSSWQPQLNNKVSQTQPAPIYTRT